MQGGGYERRQSVARGRHLARRRRMMYRRRRAAVGAVVLIIAIVVAIVATSGGGGDHPSASGHPRGSSTSSSKNAVATKDTTFAGPSGEEASWVVAENKKPGTTGWNITGPQTETGMMGYANMVQARLGQRVTLYVSTQARRFDVEAFRMGYYQGKGGRLVWRSGQASGKVQPSCPVTPAINMVQCHWSASLTFTVTSQWVQGEYLLKLVGSGGQQSYVPLTIWDPTSHATYVIMDPVLTTQVFNPFGGYDLYQGATACAADVYPCSSRSLVVSFDRPYDNSYGRGAGTYLSLVYPLTRLAEEDGLDVTYWTNITLDTGAASLDDHKVLISPGHDEEWSLSMRNAVLAAANKGVNLMFFGASPILRKVRLQASPLGPDRQIVNYRDPQEDPDYTKDPAEVSQNQWDQAPADWEPSVLVGASYIDYNNANYAPLVVSDPSSWFYRGTGLALGSKIPDVMFGDFQQYVTSDPNPPNVEILAHSPVVGQNHGAEFADTDYWTMRSSKAGVWESGTTQWIPALAPCSKTKKSCPAPLLQKLTENLLRVFGQGPVGVHHPSVGNTSKFYG